MKDYRVKCADCGVILESKHVHDYQTCECPNRTMVDGGQEYFKYGGKDMNKVLRYEPISEEWIPIWTWVTAHATAKKVAKKAKLVTISKEEYDQLNATAKKVAKKAKLVTISKKEYDQLNYVARHVAYQNTELQVLERKLREKQYLHQDVLDNCDWITVIGHYEVRLRELAANHSSPTVIRELMKIVKEKFGYDIPLSTAHGLVKAKYYAKTATTVQ